MSSSARPLLKIKLGSGDEDPARIRAIRNAAPAAELIVDANEGWTPENLAATLYAALGIRYHAIWHDTDGRPYEVCRGEPIAGLM